MRQKHRTLAEYFDKTDDTMAALGRRLGVSRSYISLLASGDRQPALDLALRIESETGVPAKSLVSREVTA